MRAAPLVRAIAAAAIASALLPLAVDVAATQAPTLPWLSTQPPRPEMRIAVPGLPEALDPAAAIDATHALLSRHVFDTLVSYREGGTDIEPALATRWTASRDGLVWTFTLREGVRFHDGTALTATEVVASFERHLRADLQRAAAVWAALLRGAPGVVREVRATGPRTVQFVLAQPYAPLLTVLAHPGLGVVRPVPGAEGAGRLVGSGPYRVADATPGRLVLEAVPGHWAGEPRTPHLVFVQTTSEEQVEADLDAKALDIWFPGAPPRRSDGALSIPGLRVGYLAFQTEKDPLSRKPIRRAFAAAIDPAVVAVVLGRAAIPLQSFLPPGVWGRREGSPVLGGSRQAVAALLREGGWARGTTPTLVVPGEAGPVDLTKLAESLQLMLEAADITVRLRVETETAARTARSAGEHDLTLAEAVVTAGDPHFLLYPLSTSEGATRGARALNFSFYRNPRLDDVLVRASQLAYRPERLRLYHRAQAMLADELPWIPLYVRLEWAVARPEVRGLRLHPTGVPSLTAVRLE